jgi:hypothetical protein
MTTPLSGNITHDLALSTPSSTSWGSQVRVLHRPLAALPSAEEGQSNSDYHSSAGWSKSQLWDHASRGARYFYLRHVARSIQSEESAALAHGTRLHRWLEVGDRLFDELVAPPEDTLTESGQVGKKSQQWALENAPGKELVSPKEIRQLRREIASIMEHRAARGLIEAAVAHEVSVRWVGPDGQLLRCRPDLVSETAWVDLKTTREADILDSFWKSVVSYGYHAQDAHYQWGMEALGMEPRPLKFVVVSTVWPHQCHVVTLPVDLVAEGRRRLLASLADIKLRMDLDYWMPDQHGEVVELPVPAHIRRMS